MALEGLSIIGESINDSVPSTHKLYEANDLEGIVALARTQDEGGAAWIDVNVGTRSAEFMGDMVRAVQGVTSKPLSIDTPDFEQARAGLQAYDPARADGKPPILNSISASRLQMFDLFEIQPFMPILLSVEREEDGGSRPNRTAEANYETARFLLDEAKRRCGISNDWVIFDPGIAPIGSDTEGLLKITLGSLKLMHEDAAFSGVHNSVGLSNFTVMIPGKKSDGSPVKGPLENAFLTIAMPLGLDFVIGSVKRKYQLLDEGDPALQCVRDVLNLEGFDCVMRVMEFYA